MTPDLLVEYIMKVGGAIIGLAVIMFLLAAFFGIFD